MSTQSRGHATQHYRGTGRSGKAMAIVERPRLRPVESFAVRQSSGEIWFTLRDPSGFAGAVEIPEAAARVAALMDGERNLSEIEAEFLKQFGDPLHPADLVDLVEQLDRRYFLDSERFRAHWKSEVQTYLDLPTRPPSHAGGAYAGDSAALTRQLDG